MGAPNNPARPHTAVNMRTLRQILMRGIEVVVRFDITGWLAESLRPPGAAVTD
jgi:hypothetical protein